MAMNESLSVTLTVNGDDITASIEPRMLLVDFLREHAATKGVRIGCEEGACGACTVHVEGQPIKSCLALAARANGKKITTVEGLGQGRALSKLQQAFVDCHALQCGYCTAGMLMSAQAFLNKHVDQDFDDDDIRQALTGNYCRCTGYNNIIHAIKVAAGKAEPLTKLEAPGENEGWIGKPVPRREDRRLVSGRGRYADSFGEAHDLTLVAVRAKRAHAKIVSIDTSQAQTMPGVRLIMTGAEAKAHWLSLIHI